MKATLIIVNHNGRDLLEKSVPAALEAAEAGGHPVMVVDDGSTDDSVEYLREKFSGVRALALPQGGFGVACNTAAAEAETEAAVLLNNDVIVTPDFLPPLLADLGADDVFAVGCKFLNPDGSLTDALGNRTSGEWRGGLLRLHHETNPDLLQQTCPQLYAMGGAMAFKRDKWQALGGFDRLYHPFYWEDADLGYRAWGRGWSVLYEPTSVVFHEQGTTMGRVHRPEHIELMSAKNAVLFTWKNLLDPELFGPVMAAQARWPVDDVLIGGLPPRRRALWAAFRQLEEAAARRAEERKERVRSDAQILELSGGGAR